MLVESKRRCPGHLGRVSAVLVLIVILHVFASYWVCPSALRPRPSRDNIRDFRMQWCRLQRWRLDWEAILSPCAGSMRWDMRAAVRSQARTNAHKSFVSKWELQPAGHFSRFWVQSVDMDGRRKSSGGDTWRVYIRQGPASLAPVVFDHDNGLYEVLVLVLEPGTYTTGITLDYTLCNGLRDPPDKFFINGTNQGLYVDYDNHILGDNFDDFINEPLGRKTAYKFTIPPQSGQGGYSAHCQDKESCRRLTNTCGLSCRLLWDGHGRWVNNTWRPYSTAMLPKPSSRHNGYLLNIGDSNGRRFSKLASTSKLCTEVFRRCDRVVNWVYEHEDNRPKIPKNQDFRQEVLLDQFSQLMSRKEFDEPSVFLFNLGTHYALAVSFGQFQQLLTRIVDLVKASSKPQMDIVWRGTTMLEREKLRFLSKKRFNTTLFRFHNNQRIQLYHTYSMDTMCKAGIKVLDMYPLSSSYPRGTTDNVHYDLEAFSPAVQALEIYYQHAR